MSNLRLTAPARVPSSVAQLLPPPNRRVWCLFAAAATLLAAPSPSSAADKTDDAHQHHQQKPNPNTERLQALTGKPFEASFLTNMIHHHKMAIQMSKLAHGRSSDALHDLSHEMMDKQESEIEQMTKWLKEWHGHKPAEMNHNDRSMEKSIAALEKLRQLKGAEFDKLFVQEMTTHHLQGIQLAELAKSKADHPELRQLGTKMVTDQQKDIQKMKEAQKI